MNNQPKPTRGGARPGSGRKSAKVVKKMRGLRLTDDEMQALKEKHGSLERAVRSLLFYLR